MRTAAADTFCAVLSFEERKHILFVFRSKSGQLNAGSQTTSCEKKKEVLPAGHMAANTHGFAKTTRQKEGLSQHLPISI